MKAEGEGKLVPQPRACVPAGRRPGRDRSRDDPRRDERAAAGGARAAAEAGRAVRAAFGPSCRRSLSPSPAAEGAAGRDPYGSSTAFRRCRPRARRRSRRMRMPRPVLLAAAGIGAGPARGAARHAGASGRTDRGEARAGQEAAALRDLAGHAVSARLLAEEMAGVLKAMGFRAEGAVGESGQTILLWRPKRRHGRRRTARRPARRTPRGARAARTAPPVQAARGRDADGGAPGDAPSPDERKRDRPRRNRGKGPAPRGGEAPVDRRGARGEARGPSAAGQAAFDKPREERKFDRPSPLRRAAPRRAARFESRAPLKGQSADPDSPFAVLAKLKG